MSLRILLLSSALVFLTGCNEILQAADSANNSEDPLDNATGDLVNDTELRQLLSMRNLDRPIRIPANLPDIQTPIAQLGKKLFFSQSLSGDLNVACASCHYPELGGADALSVSIGVNAEDAAVLGELRRATNNDFAVGRNAPTVFNTGLWRERLFWDGRVEFIDQGSISTPDSGFNQVDANAGTTLAAAQAGFPVVNEDEMLNTSFAANSTTAEVRSHLAQRLGSYGAHPDAFDRNEWLNEFQQAFGSNASAETLVTFANIAFAIGEYERSMVFVDSPFQTYVSGDDNALTDAQKRGAVLFFSDVNSGGADCVRCHRGPTFTDEGFHQVAFPQFGPLTDNTNGDTGRESFTGQRRDRYRFRTPSLLNVALTAPYGHAGTYATLDDVVAHYNDPELKVASFFSNRDWCELPQFSHLNNCAQLYSNAQTHSASALTELRNQPNDANAPRLPDINLSADEQRDLVAFLHSLTDPCAADEECLAPWDADPVLDNPDGQVLDAQI